MPLRPRKSSVQVTHHRARIFFRWLVQSVARADRLQNHTQFSERHTEASSWLQYWEWGSSISGFGLTMYSLQVDQGFSTSPEYIRQTSVRLLLWKSAVSLKLMVLSERTRSKTPLNPVGATAELSFTSDGEQKWWKCCQWWIQGGEGNPFPLTKLPQN